MASLSTQTRFLLLLVSTIFSSLQLLQCVYCTEFEIGERGGWAVPPGNDTHMYNEWASRKRFKVGDTIRFKYKKDSVMKVNKKDYNECNSTRPEFFLITEHNLHPRPLRLLLLHKRGNRALR
ncbi:UNVERIFIED_CONTAM: Early nodulin-like protein 3 [Sesamum angustifolium]|uniref:Early nodulin-like protein 3 n=1 Tax=Sesamum angustifolium TaxID=2727405 RepID=A0AAW2RNQ9_9LAMI